MAKWLTKLDVSERELSFEEIENRRLQLQQNFHERFSNPTLAKKTVRFSRWLPAAAAAVLLLVTGTLYFVPDLFKKEVVFSEAFTKAGALKIITLSDGTKITMNNASRIRFPLSFRGAKREVYLDGEAFFDVVHQKEHPFIVHTAKLKINVLGTSFNVQSYKGDKELRVSVATGKVGVLLNKKGSSAYMLLPGDHLAFNTISEQISQSRINPEEIKAWESGMFIYHNETLENISRQIERRYQVKITFKRDSLGQKRFNFKQKNDRLENIMQTLKFAGGIHYSISGNQVSIW